MDYKNEFKELTQMVITETICSLEATQSYNYRIDPDRTISGLTITTTMAGIYDS